MKHFFPNSDSLAWIDSPSALDDTVGRVKAVRSLGLDVGVDFHGRLHKGMAKQLAKLLEPYKPLFIEGMQFFRARWGVKSNVLFLF